jgi:hypothetical protein
VTDLAKDLKVVISGYFKDNGNTFYVNKLNKEDSLKKTTIKDNATVFSSIKEANIFLEKMSKNNVRFNECAFTFSEVR